MPRRLGASRLGAASSIGTGVGTEAGRRAGPVSQPSPSPEKTPSTTSRGRRRRAGSAPSPRRVARLRRRLPARVAVAAHRRLRRSARARADAAARRAGGAGHPAALAQAGAAAPEVRAAVHVGEVRVDAGAADPTAQLLPIGDVLALPERLLGHAGAGEVLLSPPAARRVERTLRARGAPLAARARRRRPPHRARASPGHASAQIRRERPPARALSRASSAAHRELDLLRDAFDRARRRTGPGRVHRRRRRHRQVAPAGRVPPAPCRRAAPLDRGALRLVRHDTPFLPIIDGLRRDLGIDDRDDEAAPPPRSSARSSGSAPTSPGRCRSSSRPLSLRVGDDTRRALDSASRRSELFRALRALTAARRRAGAARGGRRGPALDRSGVGGVARLPRRRHPDGARSARPLAPHRLQPSVRRPQLPRAHRAGAAVAAATWQR